MDDANTKALLTYIDTLPYDTIADSARKLVDAYADMLNSTDSGEGIFYPDETDANRFWTAIYNYEIDQRGYLDADDVNYWMYKGYRMDSRQNVQDVANAMYGHIVELPPRDYVPSYCPKDSDTCYYFGIGDRGAVQVALDGFERSEDGSAVLKLSYSYPHGWPIHDRAGKAAGQPECKSRRRDPVLLHDRIRGDPVRVILRGRENGM